MKEIENELDSEEISLSDSKLQKKLTVEPTSTIITINRMLIAFLVIMVIAVFGFGLRFSRAPTVYSEETYRIAPEFTDIHAWINSEPLTMNQLRGKVVLIDFWTFGCYNCRNTLPYVTSWDEKYRDQGLIIVGVHTPEFSYEKKYDNVLNAVNKHNINYPVALDNDYVTWALYQNRYWPRKYLIDHTGKIRYDHIGEGRYEETEAMIKKLLADLPKK